MLKAEYVKLISCGFSL